MRGLAKASSAGSTLSEGDGLGSLSRGAFATRGASNNADGSGAPSHRLGRLAVLVAAIVSMVALFASSALAAQSHPYTGTSFGPDGVGGTESFQDLRALTMEPSTHDLYAWDTAAEKIYKFNAAGQPVNFSATGTNAISGVTSESNSGSFQLAVAPPGSPAGTAGDIYLNDSFTTVGTYGPSGAFLGNFVEDPGFVCGVAVNQAGHLFTSRNGAPVREYVPTSNPPTVADRTGTGKASEGWCNLGLDGLGNIYLGANGALLKLDGLADPTPERVGPEANVYTVAIDQSDNDVFTDEPGKVSEYSPSGVLQGTSGFGRLGEPKGLAVDSASNTLYASNSGSGKIDVFGPPVVVPEVTTGAATEVKGRSAVLQATVNPGGLAITNCVFEYGTQSEFFEGTLGSTASCEGATPPDEADHPVTAKVTGLLPNANYVFRVKAANVNEPSVGKTANFSTQQLVEVTAPHEEPTASTAALSGLVRPEGEAVTECVFEYEAEGGPANAVPCEQTVPTDEDEHVVSADLTGLTASTQYYFHLKVVIGGTPVETFSTGFTTAPTAVTGGSDAIGGTSATVEGKLDPGGTTFSECLFEYGLSASYGEFAPCAETVAEIGSGTTPVSVHADLSNLTIGTTYHYRVVGVTGSTRAHGADATLLTLGAVIESESSDNVGLTEATLKARINAQGEATTYRIEYGPTESYGSVTPELSAGKESSGKVVAQIITGLTPNSIYHYRFVATNAQGPVIGPDKVFQTSPAATGGVSCPNEVFRSGLSGFLPDCRAYEMVSPVNKSGGDIHSLLDLLNLTQALSQSSTDGNRFTYSSYRAFADPEAAPMSNQYLAQRVEGQGWSSKPLTPQQGPAGTGAYGLNANFANEFKAFSADLCSAWIGVAAEPVLSPSAPEGYVELYRRQNCGAEGYAGLVGVKPPLQPPGEFEPELEAKSANAQVTVFRANDKLTPNANGEGESQAYASAEGRLRLICVLPSGQTEPNDCTAGYNPELAGGAFGNSALNHSANVTNAMSEDGSAVYWTASDYFSGNTAGNAGRVYLRLNPTAEQSQVEEGDCTEPAKACTVPVSQTVTSEPSRFVRGSADGSMALFEVVAGPAQGNLYRYDSASESSQLIASRVVGVAGAGESLTDIYFVSRDELPGTTGATSGKPNLYAYTSGSYAFIGTLSETDVTAAGGTFSESVASNTDPLPRYHAARASQSGNQLVFISNESLTGYDNTDAASPAACGKPGGICDTEVFMYEVGTAHPVCLSCNPTGARPHGREYEVSAFDPKLPSAGWLPTANNQIYAPRVITSDGSKVFFDSFDALLPRDNNGKEDVYEWEAASDAAGCTSAGASRYVASARGCLSLITSGESPTDSELLDITPDGSDAFFETNASLVPQDPGLVDVYDARVGGGFAASSRAVECEGEACQGPLSPPNDATPASSNYNGPGNAKAKKARKSKSHKAKHKKKKKMGARQKRPENGNRRADR